MKFYPNLNLCSFYKKNLPKSNYFSQRIPDQTVKNSIENLNRAMNVCEKNESFLDFGAGNGRYSCALLSEFDHGYGTEVDHTSPLLEVEKKHSNYKILWGENAIQKVKEKIDLIIFMDVIEHIPVKSVESLVKSTAKLQNKGGVVYISTPNAVRCGAVQKSGIYFKRFTYGHHKHYVSSELIKLFSQFGYEPTLLQYEDFPLRLFVKQFNLGFSYLDKKLSHTFFYTHLSLPVIALINLFFHILSPIVSWNEYARRNDSSSGQTLLLTLKKL